MIVVPEAFARRWRVYDPAWLARLPALVEEAAARFDVEVGAPFEGGNASWTGAATRRDGTPVVLKVNYPDCESEQEAAALELWAGDAAVRLLGHEPELRALLLERLEPGTQLWALPDEDGIRIAASLLPRLWIEPPAGHRFLRLADLAASWATELRETPSSDPELLRLAADLAAELVPTMREGVLVHQDYHQGNVLAAQREPWLTIDPKPVVGDREYGVAALLRDRRPIREPSVVRRRFDYLTAELGLDRERTRAWAVVQTTAWGTGTDGSAEQLAEARLIAELKP